LEFQQPNSAWSERWARLCFEGGQDDPFVSAFGDSLGNVETTMAMEMTFWQRKEGKNKNWLVVWNMIFVFPFSWECHDPN
jgi:hypothetical protein